MAALVVVAAIDLSRPALHRTFVALAIAGFLIQLPPLLLGPHTSLMLDHLRQPAATRGSISHALKEIRWNPADSQITDTFELLFLKLAPARWLTGATWLASFDPPLRPADIPWDVFWIHRPGHSPGTAMPVGYAARPAAR